MKLSQRVEEMQYSAIRKLNPYAAEAKKAGKEVIHLNIGVPDVPTPDVFFEVIKNLNLDRLVYAPAPGLEELRLAMSKFHKARGRDFEPEEILITNGASEALMFALYMVAEPGERILSPDPYYSNYDSYFKQTGVELDTFETYIEDDFALPEYQTMADLVKEDTRAILICNPSNPTGTVYSIEDLEKISKLAREHNLFIIADEIYSDFIYDGEKFISLSELEGLEDRLIIMDSVSKRFSACGARIGAIMAKNEDILAQGLKLCTARLAAPLVEQYGCIAMYDMENSYLTDVNKEYNDRRDLMYELLSSIQGVEVNKSKGAFYMLAKLPVDSSEDFAKWLLTDFEDKNQTVMVAPAGGFYTDPNRAVDQVRIAFAVEQDTIRRGIELLELAIKEYNLK